MQLSIWCHLAILVSLFCPSFAQLSGRFPLDFFQFPCASAAHCEAQLPIFAQVDDVGNAWVAGYTWFSLDEHAEGGRSDIFLIKFDARGVHLWTRQRGGEGYDYASALQADWGATLFFLRYLVIFFHGAKLQNSLEVLMFRVMWSGITIQMDQSLG